MCPACMATTAVLIASAISTGGAAAVLANKIRAAWEKGPKDFKDPKPKEEAWQQRTSK